MYISFHAMIYSSKILAICKVNNDKIVVNYYKKGEKASSQLSF